MMKDELSKQLWLNSDDATGVDSVLMRLLEALGDYGADKVTTLLNLIHYNRGQVPSHISKSII